VPGGRIAAVTAAVISPGFWVFAVSPMLDVRFSRRAYALITALITALAVGFTVMHHNNLAQVEAVMMAGYTAASLYQGAVGGWMGSLIDKDQDGQLGVWFAVANLGTGGLMMLAAGELMHALQPGTAALVLGIALLLPTLIFLRLPAPAPDRRLARESFGRFWADVFSLGRRKEVQIALVLFLLPSASFALTNVLGGIGKDFHASERMVSLFAGVGSATAGVVGSLMVAPLAKRFRLRPLYLGIGIVGALFTLVLLLLPRQPWTFALAITGENLFQALAFAAANGITFETIGPANPLASTTFTVLIAASNFSITYMSFLDGWGYTRAGIRGSFATDAAVSLAICALLLWLLRGFTRRGRSVQARAL
jgi:PAT family beta-lactamase induction signal transducer AmpG